MTDELTKTFFDTFGIEPNCQNEFINPSKCPFYEPKGCNDCVCFEYPQISDRILLELICIGTQFFAELVLLTSDNIEDLKEQVLTIYLKTAYKEKIKHQVRTLFEEG